MAASSTRKKLKGIFADTMRLCPAQIACDGATLARNREICGRCERSKRNRERKDRPLRGERCVNYTISRGGK